MMIISQLKILNARDIILV